MSTTKLTSKIGVSPMNLLSLSSYKIGGSWPHPADDREAYRERYIDKDVHGKPEVCLIDEFFKANPDKNCCHISCRCTKCSHGVTYTG